MQMDREDFKRIMEIYKEYPLPEQTPTLWTGLYLQLMMWKSENNEDLESYNYYLGLYEDFVNG